MFNSAVTVYTGCLKVHGQARRDLDERGLGNMEREIDFSKLRGIFSLVVSRTKAICLRDI